MYRFIFSTALLFLFFFTGKAQEDTAVVENDNQEKIIPTQHQLRIGVNISTPLMTALVKDAATQRSGYEVTLDYCLRNDAYIVAEGGFGKSTIQYPELSYQTQNSYARIGIDKSMLQRLFPNDWDMIFIGLRYGVAFIQRSEATFTTVDDFWGTTSGIIPSKNLTAHWAEMNAGMRVELLKHFFAGYNVRAKFLVNDKAFRELPPAYIAGYGKAEKSTVFDFNLYLCYALRW